MDRKEFQLTPEEVNSISRSNVPIEGVPTKNTDEAWKKIGERLQINIRTAIVHNNEGLISAEPLSDILVPSGIKRSDSEVLHELNELNKLIKAEEQGNSDPFNMAKEHLGAGKYAFAWLMGRTDESPSALYKRIISKPKASNIIMPDKKIIM